MKNETRNSHRKSLTIALLAVSVCVLALGGFGWSSALAGNTEPRVSPDEALRYADALSVAFEHAADAIRPSVVTIRAVKHFQPTQHIQNGRNLPPGFSENNPLEDNILRRFFGEMPQREMPPQQGVGSGVIVNGDGYILTNNHVVAGADEVTVVLDKGRELSAKVVGTDPMSDLAVIQVKDKDLPAATLGDSEALRVGEWVVAAGNPFGLRDTVTAGIVSAKGRSNVRIAEYEDFIQTDAAIDPGNSGGPLVDLHGRVVGISTAIASHNGGSNGVGFAIPINMAKNVMNSLIEKGQVVRGWLGVAIQPLDEALAKSFGSESNEGVLIGDVMNGGPAEKAGLKTGDIVTRFGDAKVTDVQQFRNLAAGAEPGTKVALQVLRDGKPRTISVEVSQRDAETAQIGGRDTSEELGLTVETVTPEQAESLGLNRDLHGVLITKVDPNGMAYEAGIEPGNVIIDVQGQPVANVTQFREQLAKHDLKSGVRLLVQAGEMRRFVLLRRVNE
jgi:serine protease Do